MRLPKLIHPSDVMLDALDPPAAEPHHDGAAFGIGERDQRCRKDLRIDSHRLALEPLVLGDGHKACADITDACGECPLYRVR